MPSPRLANPRRSTLATLAKGSELATCQHAGCHNVAVVVVGSGEARALVCRSHADR